MTPGRRTVHFPSLDQIMPDVERLLEGHTTVGQWSLGQMCWHLAAVLRTSADAPPSLRQDASRFVGEDVKRQWLEVGDIPEGMKAPPRIAPPEGLDDGAEAEALRQAIAYYVASSGPVVAHRLFGPLTRAEWDQFHCRHCEHHLSFARPQ